jgi:TetR/AcrR family transcriptional regulator, cholesterol catabolism regulator
MSVTDSAVDRRSAIIEAAADLFERRGYHQSSMSDIAAAVGIAKPTIYYYFTSKDEILFAIHSEFISLIIDRHQLRVPTETRVDVLLSQIMMDVVGLMETHRGHVRVFFEHHRELPDKHRALIIRERDAYEQIVIDLIDRGQREGVLRPVNTQIATLGLFGMVNWSYQWYRRGRLSTEEIAQILWDLLFSGMAPRPEPEP